MTFRDGATETEQLRTEVEELENALQRILDALHDEHLNDSERIKRAVAVAMHVQSAVAPRRGKAVA